MAPNMLKNGAQCCFSEFDSRLFISKFFCESSFHIILIASFTLGHIIIIIIFYCGLMVHFTDAITDTRAQKVVSYTSAYITETVFAHDQH